jgi:predicted metallo-beta-lactamase superfamily hydrolase
MKHIAIGNGEIRVLPLAFESLGVRGMAVFVETDDVKLVIDPGSALGPRFNLPPHEYEYVALSRTRQAIIEAARRADVLTISHYHFDHYVPNFEDWIWTWSSPEIAAEIYSGKLILAKDISRNINVSQRKRGYMFHKLNVDGAKEIRAADGQKFKFGDTTIEFSKPVYHGSEGSALGYVLMLEVRTPGCRLLHAPDVQGPMCEETLRLMLAQKLDAVMMGGPPIYLEGFKVESTDLATAQRNLGALAKHVPLLVVDHHLLRSLDYPQYLRPAMQAAEKAGNRLLTVAELVGQEPQLLEARRRELHEQEPMGREWYLQLEKGEFKHGFT